MKVLFVCVGNSARSQMAEGFFNYLSKAGSKAMSAGTLPASSVSSKAVKAMAEIGIDISSFKPKALTLEMVEEADRIITMGCNVEESCPAFLLKDKTKIEDWGLDDPVGMEIDDVKGVRDEIRRRIKLLLSEIEG